MIKKKVLLTGASGSMGYEAFKELLRRREDYDIVLLLLPAKREKKLFKRFVKGKDPYPVGQKGVVKIPGIKIVWGDLTDYQDVLNAVDGIDFVLHPAAMIPPAADHDPIAAKAVNYTGTVNIIKGIRKQPNPVKFIYISSISVYGDRLGVIHRCRVGDPVKPSVYDYYAVSKLAAERAVIESGLEYWAVLRQTYIAIPGVMGLMNPIMFHQPLDTRIELINNEDAGYGLVQCLECPDEFYGRIYNMGGGPECRVVYSDYIERMMNILGLGDYRKIMERNWFATRNFHCSITISVTGDRH
ncbi:MAG: NAD-dependent epimerase/dehydratase family protein [Candidatus Hodarchaeales archaeon]